MTVPVVNVDIATRLGNSQSSCVYSKVLLKYNIPLSEQIVNENTIYVVKWNFDLNTESLSIPHNCMLEFIGGKISNGTINWDNTKVLNPYSYAIFENITEVGRRTTSQGNFQ